MWKILLSIGLLLNFYHAFPVPLDEDHELYNRYPKLPNENDLYDNFSKQLFIELNHIALVWTTIYAPNNTVEATEKISRVWQRLAGENNVTVDQLITILEYSTKLRTLNFHSEKEAEKANTYLEEACDQYAQIESQSTSSYKTVSPVTTEKSGFLESLIKIIFKPLAMAIGFLGHTIAFVNATTTNEKLELFGELCKIRQDAIG